MPLVDFLASEHSTSMAVVVLHKGEVAFETYPRMQPYEKPIWWSVTKVLPSTLIALLEERGQIDTALPVETYVEALEGSDFEGVSVRDVLDMASGVDCPDGDYTDRTTCYYQFEASLGDAVRGPGSPDNPYDMLAELNVGKWAPPGTGFDYSGANTFVLSWIVEEVMGMPFQDAFTQEVWSQIGAEADASIYAGRLGIALTSGGLLANPRDVARFGLLFTPSWSMVSKERIISQSIVDKLLNGGRPEILENGRYGSGLGDSVRHNIYQWDIVFENDDLYKGGWAGQGLLVNPRLDLVVTWLGYSEAEGVETIGTFGVLRDVLERVYGP